MAATAALFAWDQTGLLPQVARGTSVAGISFSRSTKTSGDWDSLSRMRFEGASRDGGTGADAAPAPAVPAQGDAAIAPPPVAFDEPAPAPPPPPPALRKSAYEGVTPEGGTWAVMIGINDYPGSGHDLRSAVADATDTNEALGRLGVPGDHRLMILDRNASAGTIRASIDWLNAHAGPDAVAVFFYAGHIRKLGGGTEAIVGADGRTVTDSELASQLEGLRAHRAWIALAACYSGGFTEVLKPGRVLTAASSANSVAYENEAFGRSYLVEYMVRKALIEGAAPRPTVEAAFAWARDALARDYPDRVPVEYDTEAAEIDLRPPAAQRAASQPAGGGSPSSPPPSPTTTTPPSNSGQTPPDPKDGCANLTLGVVRCES